MSLDTVRRAAEFTLGVPGRSPRALVLWHLGEPLVVPIDWYADAHRILSEVLGADAVRFQFQTNATLLTPAWTRFLRDDTRSRVGVSIDGPSFLHDARRMTRRGAGSHARAMKGVQHLRDARVPFGCIAVVTRQTLDHPDEFYDFFVELRPESLALNPEGVDGANAHSSLSGPAHEVLYRRFLRRFIDCWLRDGRPFGVREFRRVEALFHGDPAAPSLVRNDQATPGSILSFDWQGNVHTFSPELLGVDVPGVGRNLGNIYSDNWTHMTENAGFRQLKGAIDHGVEECAQGCEYFRFCKGGSPGHKWFELGTFAGKETAYCRLTVKAPFDEYLEGLRARLPRAGETRVEC